MSVSEPDGFHNYVSTFIVFCILIILFTSLVLLLARATFSCRIRGTEMWSMMPSHEIGADLV